MSNKRRIFTARFFAYFTGAIILLAGAITLGLLGLFALLVVVALGAMVTAGLAVFEYIRSKNSPNLRLQTKLNELFQIHPNKNEGGRFFVPDSYTNNDVNQLFTEIDQLVPQVDDKSLEGLIRDYFLILICFRNSISQESLSPSSQNHQLFFLQKLNSTFALCLEYRLKTNISLEKILDFMTGWFEAEHTNLFHQPFFIAYLPSPKLVELAPIALIATALTNLILREITINSDSTQLESYLNKTIGLFNSFNKKSFEDYISTVLNDTSSANANINADIKTHFASAQTRVAEQLNRLLSEQKILNTKKTQPQQVSVEIPQVVKTYQPTVVSSEREESPPVEGDLSSKSRKKHGITPRDDSSKSPTVSFSPPIFAAQKTTIQHTDEIWQKMREYLERYWGFTTYQDTADGLFVACRTQESNNFWCDQINNRLGSKMVEPATLDGCLGFLFKAENFPAILAAAAAAKANESSHRPGCSIL